MEVDQHLQNDSEGIPPPIVVITNVHEDASFVSMKAENTEDQPPINQHEQRVKENTNRTAHHHEEETESDNDMEHQNTNTSVQNNNTAQNPQQQKLQMARTLVEVSKGSVSLERVMAMSFDEVQNLHNKIVYRLNKSGQQQQAQCDQFNSNNISNQTTAPSQQNRAQDDDPSSINTGAPTQPNNVNIAQNNVIKAQQTTNNNMAMTEPDKLSKKERKSSRKSSKKSSKKKSRKRAENDPTAAQHHPQAQPQQAQAQAQQRDPSNPHPDQYNTSNPTASNAYASTYAAYNNGNAHHNTQHAAPNQANTTANAPNMPADTNGAGTTGGPNANIMFDNENPIDIVLVLLHQYPQIETWLQSMEYHGTVTTSRTHAVQFLTSLMDSQPQFTQLIKLIQQQLKQRRAQGGDPTQAARNLISGGGSGINTGAPTQPNNVNIAQNNAIKAQQMTNNNMAMTEPDKLSKKERKSSRKSSKKSSKKKSKKSHKKSSKKSSKKSKKKKSKRKSSSKRGSNESDEDYGAAYPMNGGANESGSDFNPSSGRKSSPKKRRKKKRKKRHSSKRVVKEASEAEFTGGETEEEGEQIANMSGDESEDYNPGVAVGNVGSRRSDRKRRSKKRNIDQMSNGSHMTSRNKRQKTSHGPKNKNLMQYISPAPVHWKMMSCTDDGEEANSGRFRLKLKCIRHPIKEAVMRIGAHKFGLDDVLDTLCDVEQNGDEIRRSRSAKKRLKEELLQLRGCYNTKGGSAAIDSESDYNVENKFCDEFVANEFIIICQSYIADGAGVVSDDVCHKCVECQENKNKRVIIKWKRQMML
eukprot:40758_1